MKLKALGSGSSGNCYILENESEALIIEAGLPFTPQISACGTDSSRGTVLHIIYP